MRGGSKEARTAYSRAPLPWIPGSSPGMTRKKQKGSAVYGLRGIGVPLPAPQKWGHPHSPRLRRDKDTNSEFAAGSALNFAPLTSRSSNAAAALGGDDADAATGFGRARGVNHDFDVASQPHQKLHQAVGREPREFTPHQQRHV